MKKLASAILICMMITGAFVSCGSADSDSEKATTASSTEIISESSTEELTDSGNDAEVSSAAGASEDVSSGEATTASSVTKAAATDNIVSSSTAATEAEERTTADVSQLKGGDVIGKWQPAEDQEMIIEFTEDGNIAMKTDASSMLSFKDGKALIGGSADAELKFDGTNCTITYMDQEFITMKRNSGGSSETDMSGDYTVTGGRMLESYGGAESDLHIVIAGDKTYIEAGSFGTYEISGNKLTVCEGTGDDEYREVLIYGVEGDKLVTVDERNNTDEFVKVD